jgi:hypothetical protein
VYHVVKQVLSFSPSWEVENLRSRMLFHEEHWRVDQCVSCSEAGPLFQSKQGG